MYIVTQELTSGAWDCISSKLSSDIDIVSLWATHGFWVTIQG